MDKKRGKRRLGGATRARSIHGDKKDLSAEQREQLLSTVKDRFENNVNCHKGLEWAKVANA
jgi:hypothetical protein